MKKLGSYIAFAVALNCLTIVFFIDTLKMPKAAYQMPRLLIGVVALLSLLMVAEQVWLMRKGLNADLRDSPDDREAVVTATASAPTERSSFIRIGVFVTALFLYVMTIETLGYFITTPLFLIGILSFLRSTKLPYAIAIAIGFTGFVYLLFVLFLNLPVPMGLLDNG
ncbi:MAG: tripartite tricarboxylate transporter TctB family protein [Desulfuromonadales bacterium]